MDPMGNCLISASWWWSLILAIPRFERDLSLQDMMPWRVKYIKIPTLPTKHSLNCWFYELHSGHSWLPTLKCSINIQHLKVTWDFGIEMYKAGLFRWTEEAKWRFPLLYGSATGLHIWPYIRINTGKQDVDLKSRFAACFGRCIRCIRDKTATTEVQLWKFLKLSSGFWGATHIQQWHGNGASITHPKTQL